MVRISAIFISTCMVLIAGSLGFVVYLRFGFTGAESALVALGTLTALAVYNAISARKNDRLEASNQLANLARGSDDLARQLAEFGLAVEREEPHARRVGGGDVALLLDRVAERQSFRGRAVVEAQGNLRRARDVKIRALLGQHRDDFGRRVRLHRIIDAGNRQIPAQHVVGLADDVEIDDEARGRRRVLAEETGDLLVHVMGYLLEQKADQIIRSRAARPKRRIASTRSEWRKTAGVRENRIAADFWLA